MVADKKQLTCPISGNQDFRLAFEYHQKPEGEITFSFNQSGTAYHREIWQNQLSKHYISIHEMSMDDMYADDYVTSTYKDIDGIHKTFQRIINLDPIKSDNVGRVNTVVNFAKQHFGNDQPKTVLDIGSGLGVFPYAIEQAGWSCTALDPDQRAAYHLQNKLGINTIHGDFNKVPLDNKFDVITINKVLEHVDNPVEMLSKAKNYLKEDGFIYIEIPDGEMAALYGKGREEFFIDHLHIFSLTSTSILIDKAGCKSVAISRLQEPSTKFTIRAFMTL